MHPRAHHPGLPPPPESEAAAQGLRVILQRDDALDRRRIRIHRHDAAFDQPGELGNPLILSCEIHPPLGANRNGAVVPVHGVAAGAFGVTWSWIVSSKMRVTFVSGSLSSKRIFMEPLASMLNSNSGLNFVLKWCSRGLVNRTQVFFFSIEFLTRRGIVKFCDDRGRGER